MNQSNEELLKAAAGGDLGAFEELIRALEARVAGVIIGMLGRCPEAEDVGQETFIRFYQGLDKFRGKSSVSSYVTRIAINLSLNELRKRKKNNARFSDIEDAYTNNIQDRERYDESFPDKELAWQALQRVRPEFRIVLVLRLMEEYTTKETAALLDVPEGTVMSRLARGLKEIRKVIFSLEGETK